MAAEAKRAAAEARKAAKEARNAAAREKEDHIKAVRAAANAEGLTAFIGERIPASKTVDEIIATLRARKTKANKNAVKAAKGPTRKAASIVRSLLRQVKAQGPALSNSAIGKITSKMTVENIIAKAQKRMFAKGKKAVRNTSRASLKRRLKNAGIASANIKFTKNATYNTLLAAAQKRGTAKQAKAQRQTAQQVLEQAAREAGIDPKFIKLKKDERLSATIRAAVKRRNATSKKDRRVLVKQAILAGIAEAENSDITEEDIKSAFCTRAK